MSWIIVSILSAMVSGLVAIFDKTVIYRYARSPLTLPLLIGIAQTIVGLVSLSIASTPITLTVSSSLSAICSGILFGLGGNLAVRVLFNQEVSRTIPVTQSAPIFTALFGWILLNESLSPSQLIGVLATVTGAVAISVNVTGSFHRMILGKSFYILMLSAFFLGTANVAGKFALHDLSILTTHGLRMIALGSVFLLLNLRSDSCRDVISFFKDRSAALLFAAINEFLLANAYLLLFLWALSLGPAALVTALVGTRALFVVIFSTGIACFWKGALGEQITRKVVATKMTSAALIVVGVGAIAL